jgi:hypothetical protein
VSQGKKMREAQGMLSLGFLIAIFLKNRTYAAGAIWAISASGSGATSLMTGVRSSTL